MEYPILRLALLGFKAPAAARLAQWLKQPPPGWPRWQLAEPEQADAWCVDGTAIAGTDERGRLRVVTGWPRQPQVSIDPEQITHPIALALPLPEGMESKESFDPSREAEVRQALQRFEAWLRPLRTQFALGARLLENQFSLAPHVYHLMIKHNLVAVVDLVKMQVGISPKARPIDMDEAGWEKRPESAADIPSAFIRQSVAQVMWTYAMRTERDLLPPRYRDQLIYPRTVCAVPTKWLQNEHLQLLSELKSRSATLSELVRLTGLGLPEVSRCLTALYFAGSITTEAQRERRSRRRGAEPEHSPLAGGMSTLSGPDGDTQIEVSNFGRPRESRANDIGAPTAPVGLM